MLAQPTHQTFYKHNPYTGQVLYSLEPSSSEAIQQTLAAARQALPTWQHTTPKQRATVLRTVVTLIQSQAEPLAQLIHEETGKPLREAYEADLMPAVAFLEFLACHGPRVLKEKRMPLDKMLLLGRVHTQRRLAWGVVGVISPWNYPLSIPATGVATALMAGNTAVLKPSEETSRTGQALAQLFWQALAEHGFDKNILGLLEGDGAVGQSLVEGDIDYLIFTGSQPVGFHVRSLMQAQGKATSLELGGNDACLILESVQNLEAALSQAFWGRMTNAGQSCSAVKRLFVPASLYAQAVEILQAKLQALQPDIHVGPLISAQQQARVLAQLQTAISLGAQAVQAQAFLPQAISSGYWVSPTLLFNTQPHWPVMQEECFGPILPVYAYQQLSTAVAQINASPFGLTASVFGEPKEAKTLASKIQVGYVGINELGTSGYAIPGIPWTGQKYSGPGISHGLEGLLSLTQLQSQTENLLFDWPFWAKPPWLFSANTAAPPDLDFSRAILRAFAPEALWQKLNTGFLQGVWRNRSNTRL